MARRPTEDDIRHLYRDTIDDLYGFVSRRSGGDRALAEDVTQETWLRAVKAWRGGNAGAVERGRDQGDGDTAAR